MGGPGQLPQRTVPALLAKLAEARKFKSNFISFLAPLLRNTPMKIYFVLTRYQSNAKRVFSLSRPQEFLIYFLFLFCSGANLKRSLPVSCGFLQQPFPSRLTSRPRTKPVEKSPLRHSGSPNWKRGWCRGVVVLQQTCHLFPIPPLVHPTGAPHPKETKSSDTMRAPAKVFTQSTCQRTSFLGKSEAGGRKMRFPLGAKHQSFSRVPSVCTGHPQPHSPHCRCVLAA